MGFKKRVNQFFGITLSFALVLTMNAPIVAWGASANQTANNEVVAQSALVLTAVQEFEMLVAQLPDAAAVTVDDTEAVSSARNAYNSLDGTDKALVAESYAKVTAISAALDLLNTAKPADDNPVNTSDSIVEGNVVTSSMVARVGDEEYPTLQEAINAAATKQDGTVTMLLDVELSESVTLGIDQKIVLDLSGKALTVTKDKESNKSLYAIDNSGVLTLKDSAGSGSITTRGVENTGTLVIDGGTVTACDADGGAAVWNEGEFVLNGGSLQVVSAGSAGSYTGPGCLNNSGTATLNGGLLESASTITYALISTGTLTVPAESTVSINAVKGSVAINGGKSDIQAGAYEANEWHALYLSATEGAISAKIGGKVVASSQKYEAVVVGGNSDDTPGFACSATISGGSFVGASGKDAIRVTQRGEATQVTASIEGGEFSSDVTKYCAPGYMTQAKNDGSGMFDVVSEVVSVKKLNGTEKTYDTLVSALGAVSNGDIVTLLRDEVLKAGNKCTVDNTYFTLDLNGHSVSGTEFYTLYVSKRVDSSEDNPANVIIKNGSIENRYAGEGESGSTLPSIALYVNQSINLTLDNVKLSANPQKDGIPGYGLRVGNSTTNQKHNPSVTVTGKDTSIRGSDAGITVISTKARGIARLVLEDGIIEGGSFGIAGNGECDNTSIEIKGGTVSSEAADGCAIYHPQDGNLTVTGGTIKGSTGIEVRAGTLNVSGGATIAGTASSLNVKPGSGGNITEGVGIAIVQHTTKLPIDVNISGGAVSGFSALYEGNPEKNPEGDIAKVQLSITGGSFAAINNGTTSVYSEDCTDFITGGTFNTPLLETYFNGNIYSQNAQDADENPGTVVPRMYPIVYNLAGGVLADGASNVVSYSYFDDEITLMNPMKTGYTFAGWTGTDIKELSTNVVIPKGSTGDRSYTATWAPGTDTAYQVEHYQQNLDGTYVLATTDRLKGETDTLATASVKQFAGFSLNESAQGSIATGLIRGDGSLVLKLYYDRNSHEVSYAYTGDVPADAPTVPVTISYKFGQTVPQASVPTLVGYDFSGWSKTEVFVMPDENVVVTGSWTAKSDVSYTVHYYLDGTTQKLTEDKSVPGCTFGKSYTEEAPKIEGYTVKVVGPQEIVVNAYDKEVLFYYSANEARIVFKTNGGSSVSDIVGKTGENVEGSLPAPLRDGYGFVGWYADEACTIPANELPATFPIGTTTYYAQWNVAPLPNADVEIQVEVPQPVEGEPYAKVPEKVVKSAAEQAQSAFDTIKAGGTPSGMSAQDAQAVVEVLAKAAPEDKVSVVVSLKFAEKSQVEDTEKSAIEGASDNGESVVLYLDLSVEMTVRVLKGGAVEDEKTIPLGQVDEPLLFEIHLDPALIQGKSVRIAHVHNGATEVIQPESVDRERGVVRFYAQKFSTYALLTSETVTVTFETNGGAAVDVQTVGFGQKAAKPADPTRKGFTFVGWFADAAFIQAYDFASPVERSLTLFAKWAAVEPGGSNPVEQPAAKHALDTKPLPEAKKLAPTGDVVAPLVAGAAVLVVLAGVTIALSTLRCRKQR